MPRSSLRFLALAAAVLVAASARAVPVAPLPQTVAQPDGTSLTLRPTGDEFGVYWELPSGHTVIQDAEGWWRLATVAGDGSLVARQDVAPGRFLPETLRRLPRHVRPSLTGPARSGLAPARAASPRALDAAHGNVPLLVVLVEFTDRAPVGSSAASFQEAFFGAGKSVARYYHEATYGKLEMTPIAETHGTAGDGVVGWIKLSMNHPNRGISGSSTATEQQKNTAAHNTRLAVKAAIEAADPYVDFSAYDTDGNGALSREEIGVVVITAGYESSYGGYKTVYSPANWGHRWVLDGNDGVGVVAAPTVDGVKVGSYLAGGGYSSFGEWMQTSASNGHRATIGVMVHELGHDTLGLPDLYDTDSSSEGVGAWCLMSGGSWGSDSAAGSWSGDTPVQLSAWPRLVTGISQPTDLAGAGTATAAPVYESGQLFRVGSGRDSEFFLLEYRSPQGWDAGLRRYDLAGFNAGGGLAIWHVDESVADNDDEAHKKVDLEEANGLNYLDSGVAEASRTMLFYAEAFPSFTDMTSPGAGRYDASPTGVAVTGIGSAEAGGISFAYAAPNPVGFAGDLCGAAIEVPLGPGESRALSEGLAQATGGDTPPLCAPISATGWFKVVPRRTGTLTVDLSGSSFDTVAAVLAGSCGDLRVLGCNDDIGGTPHNTASRVAGISVQRGVPVWVVVGSYGSGSGGGGTLGGAVSMAPATPLTVTTTQAGGCPRLDWTFTVSSAGVPVTGLTADAFTLLVDGAEAPVAAVTELGGGAYLVTSLTLVGGVSGSHPVRLEVDTATATGEAETVIYENTTACAGVSEPAQTLVVPAAAHVGGVKGTNWRSDVFGSLLGGAGSWADVEISYLAHGQPNPAPARRVLGLGAGGASYGDAAASLFGVAQGKGALLVRWKGHSPDASGGSVHLTSRTYNLLGADNEMGLPEGSTFGQEIPAIPVGGAIQAGAAAWITGLVQQPGADRTNLGLVAAGDAGAAVSLEFFGPTGETLLIVDVPLGAWEYRQLDQVLGAVPGGVSVASVRISVGGGSDPVVAYASVVDGLTGDPVALMPVGEAAATWFVPAAAHVTGVNDTNWRTDLAVVNTGSVAVQVQVAFLEEGKDNSTPQVSTPLVLPAGGSTRIVNVVPTLFNRQGVKGALRVVADGPVAVSSRTYNLLLSGNRWGLAEGATFGQNVPGLQGGDGLAAGETGVIPGLVRNASYRGNLAFLNLSPASVTFRVRILDGDGAVVGAPVLVTAKPYEAGQRNDIVGWAGIAGDLEDATVLVDVTAGEGPVAVFLSGVDNRTGDPVTRLVQR